MSLNASIDVERFQQQVAEIADRLDARRPDDGTLAARRLGVLPGQGPDQIVDEIVTEVFNEAVRDTALGSKDEIRQAAVQVRTALTDTSVRATLCRSLGPLTSKSSREIAVEITKAALPLALTGQLAVPASPLVWGLLGVAVAWVGVTWVCSDVDFEDR